MPAVIKSITPDSPATQTIIKPQDTLLRVNGEEINDILDYLFYCADSRLVLELIDNDGMQKYVTVSKPDGAELGLEFETFLIDSQRSCENSCIFCFIDQLPGGMRESLYVKDDDLRLSFLQGNYITLTNLSRADTRRVITQRISPINISIHTLDPNLRHRMLRSKKAKEAINSFYTLAKRKIILNCQIVCCPGINDGARLNRTLKKLKLLGPAINSVSVVPVGLTKYRDGLAPILGFDRELAGKTIKQVHRFAKKNFRERGKRVFYCSDELYILAGLKLPSYSFYEEFPQLENGVGMMRLFMTEFLSKLQRAVKFYNDPDNKPNSIEIKPFSIATGILASYYLKSLVTALKNAFGNVFCHIYPIKNEFFGESITVSGLLTGRDLVRQLRGEKLGSRLLIPQNMLRRGEDVFLDDMTVEELSVTLGVPIRIVRQDGADFFNAIME